MKGQGLKTLQGSDTTLLIGYVTTLVVCACARACLCMCVCTYMCVRVHLHVCACVRMCVRVHVCASACVVPVGLGTHQAHLVAQLLVWLPCRAAATSAVGCTVCPRLLTRAASL